jgi:hypothetical protein
MILLNLLYRLTQWVKMGFIIILILRGQVVVRGIRGKVRMLKVLLPLYLVQSVRMVSTTTLITKEPVEKLAPNQTLQTLEESLHSSKNPAFQEQVPNAQTSPKTTGNTPTMLPTKESLQRQVFTSHHHPRVQRMKFKNISNRA